jgi:PPOX class probable F420-dependent enzyme
VRLPPDECRRRLGASRVAHLGTADGAGTPHVVPVTFAVAGADELVLCVDEKPKSTYDLKRLRNIRANPRTCLLADAYEEDWTRLWWVRADGSARVEERPDRREQAVGLLTAKYPQYAGAPPSGPVIWVDVHGWSGWAAR